MRRLRRPTQEPADFAAAAAEAEADTELVLSVVFVADPVDEGESSFVVGGFSGAVVVCDVVVVGAAVVGGVVVGELLGLGDVDVLGLTDGDTVGLVVGLVVVTVGLGVGLVVVTVGLGVAGFVVLWSLGRSGSGAPRSGPSTVPAIEP